MTLELCFNVLMVMALLVSIATPVSAFSKDFPDASADPVVASSAQHNIGRKNGGSGNSRTPTGDGAGTSATPGTYTEEEYRAAQPSFSDPLDGPTMRCTACLAVSDAVARRFGKLKTEFRYEMNLVKEYHAVAALDDLCNKDSRFIGLMMPNATTDSGKRVIRAFKADREQKEKAMLSSPDRQSPEGQALARDRQARLSKEYVILPEFGDEREILAATRGGVPHDVTVLKNVRLSTQWQTLCADAIERLEDFGVLKVFRGSKSFQLCPMCKEGDGVSASTGRARTLSNAGEFADKAAKHDDAMLKKAAASKTAASASDTKLNQKGQTESKATGSASQKTKKGVEDVAAEEPVVKPAKAKAPARGQDPGDDDEDLAFIEGAGDDPEL